MSAFLRLGWGNFLVRYITDTLSSLLPRRFKRMFYVGSALGLFLNNSEPDQDLLRAMNSALKLAFQAEGLFLSVKVYALVWKNSQDKVIYLPRHGRVRVTDLRNIPLNESDRHEVGIWFAKNAPMCLRYGPVEMMADDVENMIMVEKSA